MLKALPSGNPAGTFQANFIMQLACTLFFPPIGVTQADHHITGHPWGLVLVIKNISTNDLL